MGTLARSVIAAAAIAVAVQCFTVGFLAPYLPREFFLLCHPVVEEERNLTLPPAQQLVFEGGDGALTVTAADVESVSIVATIRAYGPSEGDVGLVQDFVSRCLSVTSDGQVLHVAAQPAGRPDLVVVRVDCDLTVPLSTDLEVRTGNGNVRVSGGVGRVAINTNNSDIQLTAPQGSVSAKNVNGRIRVVDAPLDATLETVNGNISAYMRGGTLRARTANGHIIAVLQTESVLACDLATINGGITVSMPAGHGADVAAETENGIVRTDISSWERSPETVQRSNALFGRMQAPVLERPEAPEKLVQLKMQAQNGNIWIMRNQT